MSQTDVLLYEKTGKIGRVIINRPKDRNAFNERDCNQRRG